MLGCGVDFDVLNSESSQVLAHSLVSSSVMRDIESLYFTPLKFFESAVQIKAIFIIYYNNNTVSRMDRVWQTPAAVIVLHFKGNKCLPIICVAS